MFTRTVCDCFHLNPENPTKRRRAMKSAVTLIYSFSAFCMSLSLQEKRKMSVDVDPKIWKRSPNFVPSCHEPHSPNQTETSWETCGFCGWERVLLSRFACKITLWPRISTSRGRSFSTFLSALPETRRTFSCDGPKESMSHVQINSRFPTMPKRLLLVLIVWS